MDEADKGMLLSLWDILVRKALRAVYLFPLFGKATPTVEDPAIFLEEMPFFDYTHRKFQGGGAVAA